MTTPDSGLSKIWFPPTKVQEARKSFWEAVAVYGEPRLPADPEALLKDLEEANRVYDEILRGRQEAGLDPPGVPDEG